MCLGPSGLLSLPAPYLASTRQNKMVDGRAGWYSTSLLPSPISWALKEAELSTLPYSNKTVQISPLLSISLLAVWSIREMSLYPYSEAMWWCRLVPRFHWYQEWSWTSIPLLFKKSKSHCSSFTRAVSVGPSMKLNIHIHPALILHLT